MGNKDQQFKKHHRQQSKHLDNAKRELSKQKKKMQKQNPKRKAVIREMNDHDLTGLAEELLETQQELSVTKDLLLHERRVTVSQGGQIKSLRQEKKQLQKDAGLIVTISIVVMILQALLFYYF
jgi:hypothetical protein